MSLPKKVFWRDLDRVRGERAIGRSSYAQIDRDVERAIDVLAAEPFAGRADQDFTGHLPLPAALLVNIAQLVAGGIWPRTDFLQTDARRQPLGR